MINEDYYILQKLVVLAPKRREAVAAAVARGFIRTPTL